MDITNCPMCETLIPTEHRETAKTCTHCGADFTRWIRKPIAPPVLEVVESSPLVEDKFNMKFGILGAIVGALVGSGAMYGFYALAGFRFPLLGVGIGALTGYGAKIFYKGTDDTLGIVSGGIALAAVVGTLYLMYGTFPMISIISVVVSVSVAYKISSR
jgi:hypothetical protein